MRRGVFFFNSCFCRSSRSSWLTLPYAFTLVEMLIVMALIAMLAGTLAVAALHARGLSVRVECQSHMKEIGTTLNGLMLADGGKFPALGGDGNGMHWWAKVFAEWQDGHDLGKVGELPGGLDAFHCRMGGALQNLSLADSGTATGGTTTVISDSSKSWTDDQHRGCWLRIASGANDGEKR